MYKSVEKGLGGSGVNGLYRFGSSGFGGVFRLYRLQFPGQVYNTFNASP